MSHDVTEMLSKSQMVVGGGGTYSGNHTNQMNQTETAQEDIDREEIEVIALPCILT